jgi:p-hydroxybenzoate 3-monooxygenase
VTVPDRTQVGIVGGGPAGLLLSHLLARAGIDSVVLESRDRAYVEARQRAGVIEVGTAELLRDVGLGARMARDGLVHGGIYLQFAGERHHLDFVDLTGGGTVTVWAQTEIVKDLVAARLADGGAIEFEAEATALDDLTTERPVIRYRDATGTTRELRCDAIAGCDGFHGVSRPAIPALSVTDHEYPYAWLGILADVPPSTDELIYAHHTRGFALHSLRSPQVSRLYLQVAPDERIEEWPDDRIWSELATRLGVPGWTLQTGPVREKGITPMRSFVSAPMRHGRLFLAGDAAHIVPPTGAKGLNLAMADAVVLAEAIEALLLRGDSGPADTYSDRCLRRVWRATHFSWWMTSMLHRPVGGDTFDAALQLSQLHYVATSRAAATSLAENYVGYTMRAA